MGAMGWPARMGALCLAGIVWSALPIGPLGGMDRAEAQAGRDAFRNPAVTERELLRAERRRKRAVERQLLRQPRPDLDGPAIVVPQVRIPRPRPPATASPPLSSPPIGTRRGAGVAPGVSPGVVAQVPQGSQPSVQSQPVPRNNAVRVDPGYGQGPALLERREIQRELRRQDLRRTLRQRPD